MSKAVEAPIIKGHCPNCGPERKASVVGYHRTRWSEEDAGIWGEDEYRILKCRGCDRVYFQEASLFSEDLNPAYSPDSAWKISHWPAASRRNKPEWIAKILNVDVILYSLFENIYTALDNDLRVLAAIGARTAFDRAANLLKVDESKGFAQKLDELMALGKIGSDEKAALLILTDAGSAAAHRGWAPTEEELGTMMDIIENFLYRAFVIDPAAKILKSKVPAKKPAQQKKKSN